MFDKIYELICDNPNCSAAMNHIYGSLKRAKLQAIEYGHIVVGNKCYCDKKCYEESKKRG